MLNVDNLHVAYGQSEVLHGLSFQAQKNQTVAILGRNGMCKTTLLKALIGILPMTLGRVAVAGNDVSAVESFQRVA